MTLAKSESGVSYWIFWFILHTATLRDNILKWECSCYVLGKNSFGTCRIKPRPLRKTSRSLLSWLRPTVLFSSPDSYPLFLPLARSFLQECSIWFSVSSVHQGWPCHHLYTFCNLWLDCPTSPQPDIWAVPLPIPKLSPVRSPPWKPPSWLSWLLLICSLEILNGLPVLTHIPSWNSSNKSVNLQGTHI